MRQSHQNQAQVGDWSLVGPGVSGSMLSQQVAQRKRSWKPALEAPTLKNSGRATPTGRLPQPGGIVMATRLGRFSTHPRRIQPHEGLQVVRKLPCCINWVGHLLPPVLFTISSLFLAFPDKVPAHDA